MLFLYHRTDIKKTYTAYVKDAWAYMKDTQAYVKDTWAGLILGQNFCDWLFSCFILPFETYSLCNLKEKKFVGLIRLG